MNVFKRIFKYLTATPYKFVRSVNTVNVVEKSSVSIEVIPREITDIKIGFQSPALFVGHLEDDTCGYKSLNNAIGDAEHIGFRLLDYVVAENLSFFFSESIESFQLAFTAFIANYGITYKLPYFMKDCSCPKDADDYYRGYKGQSDIRAIVLCKVVNTKVFQSPLWAKKQKSSDYGNCYKIGWGELQKINKIFYESIFRTHCLAP